MCGLIVREFENGVRGIRRETCLVGEGFGILVAVAHDEAVVRFAAQPRRDERGDVGGDDRTGIRRSDTGAERFWCKVEDAQRPRGRNSGEMSKRLSLDERFKGRHFLAEVIVVSVRWYLEYKLSSRDISRLMAERDQRRSLDHSSLGSPVRAGI